MYEVLARPKLRHVQVSVCRVAVSAGQCAPAYAYVGDTVFADMTSRGKRFLEWKHVWGFRYQKDRAFGSGLPAVATFI